MPERIHRAREMKPGHWFWLEKAVVREYLAKVGPSAFAVYCFLATCVDKNQMCFPSQAYVARSLGCSRSTVSRGTDELEKMNLIHRGVGLSGRTEYYLLAVDIHAKDCTDEHPLSHVCNDDVAPVDTIYNQEREETNNNGDRVRLLARDLAEKLRNPGGTPIYEAYARKYPEQILRRVLSEATEVPDWKISKSRAHLFTFLLKKYV